MQVPPLGAPPGRIFQTFGRTTRRIEYPYHPPLGRAFGLRPLYCPWPRCIRSIPIFSLSARPSLVSTLRIARGLGWCDHDYPRWGGHTTEAHLQLSPCSAYLL